MGNSSEIIHF